MSETKTLETLRHTLINTPHIESDYYPDINGKLKLFVKVSDIIDWIDGRESNTNAAR